MFKGLTDKKFKLFNDNVNYKKLTYYILLVFIILTYLLYEKFQASFKTVGQVRV